MQKMFPIFDNKAFDIKQIRNENVLKRKSIKRSIKTFTEENINVFIKSK